MRFNHHGFMDSAARLCDREHECADAIGGYGVGFYAAGLHRDHAAAYARTTANWVGPEYF